MAKNFFLIDKKVINIGIYSVLNVVFGTLLLAGNRDCVFHILGNKSKSWETNWNWRGSLTTGIEKTLDDRIYFLCHWRKVLHRTKMKTISYPYKLWLRNHYADK